MKGAIAIFALSWAAAAAHAVDLPIGARLSVERIAKAERYVAAVAPFDGDAVPSVSLDGEVHQRAWQVASAGLTPLQILRPIRAQFEAAGFELVFDCADAACGGFDFRFAIDVLPAPGMYVALNSYHFAALRNGAAGSPDALATILVSTTGDAAYIQLDEVWSDGAGSALAAAIPSTDIAPIADGAFFERGAAILDDLDFASGATQLGAGPFPSLLRVAGILRDNPGLRVALVGHTDSVGTLEQNIDISKARALAVRDRLIDESGIEASRVEAHGAGYMAPIAPNTTRAGRAANRRVEVILLTNGGEAQ